MPARGTNAAIAASLLFAVVLWGGSNAGTKWLVQSWPPIFTGGIRFLAAGLLLLGLLRWTNWLGPAHLLNRDLRRRLWLHGGLSLATYIIAFNFALKFTSVSHVTLYLGAAPVWALVWEGVPDRSWRTVQRYGAAVLALTGVLVLLWPALKDSNASLPGELLGLTCSILWTNYGRQCRVLASQLGGAEISGHTMWRAALWLLPLGSLELLLRNFTPSLLQVGVQAYCVIAGGVISFALWNNALRHWPTSQVLLFNNLIPLSSMIWAHVCLGEAVTATFWAAMVLIATGVVFGQWQFGEPRTNPNRHESEASS